MRDNECVMCGEYVVEGRLVCFNCYNEMKFGKISRGDAGANKSRNEKLLEIFNHLNKLTEECAELIQAMEMADVKVLITQFELARRKMERTIRKTIEYKVDRELKRIAGK